MILIFAVILVTGGYKDGGLSSMEALYANGTSWKQCILPDLPETRYQHSLIGGSGMVVCGGWGPGIGNCQRLEQHWVGKINFGWVGKKNLQQNRTMHSIWVSPKGDSQAAVIMGGGGNAKTTEKIESWSGGGASKHFPLKYNIE